MLPNAAKFQGYSFDCFRVIKGKPTGGGGKITSPSPHRLGLSELKVNQNISYSQIFKISSGLRSNK